MKKLTTTTSPFLMMIIPVVLFIGLSLTLKQTSVSTNDDLSTTTITTNATNKLVKVGEDSIVRFLMNK